MTHKITITKKEENGLIEFEIEGITRKEKGEIHKIVVNPGLDAVECIKQAADAIIKSRTQKSDTSKIPDEINL
jgi:hypothetical protein